MTRTLDQFVAEMPDDERRDVAARTVEILAELAGLTELRRPVDSENRGSLGRAKEPAS
jgi:hypothetical protein